MGVLEQEGTSGSGSWTLPVIKNLRQDQVPSTYREPYIHTRYRSCRSSIAACLLSAFRATNETLNFWTHFLPFLLLSYVTIQYLLDRTFIGDPFHWPFVVFLLASCCYLLGSSAAHIFNSHSEITYLTCFFIDYATVSIYIMGVGVAYAEYAFPKSLLNSLIHRLYLPVLFILSLLFSAASCDTKLSKHPFIRIHGRKITFPIYFCWCNLPLFYRAIFGSGSSPPSSSPSWTSSEADPYHVWYAFFAAASAITYGLHFPEVLAPGRFDFFAGSHQLFHLANVGITYSQHHALLLEMRTRKEELVTTVGLPTVAETFGVLALNVFLHVLLITALGWWLRKPGQLKRVKSKQGITTDPLKEE